MISDSKVRPTWIAMRTLTDPQGGPDVEVRLGTPTSITPERWECPYRVGEPGQPAATQTGCGVDAFQALVQAQEGIRITLERLGRKLSWLDGEPGFTGFTRSIPISFGYGLVQHLEALVEAELEKYAQEAAAGKHGRPWMGSRANKERGENEDA